MVISYYFGRNIAMATNPQTSFKLRVERSITDNPTVVKHQLPLRKASTLSNKDLFDMELLYTLDPEAFETNPFLKARLKAHLSDISKSKPQSNKGKKQELDSQAPLFSQERITLKKLAQSRKSLNQTSANELKKLMESSINLVKKKSQSNQ